MRTGILSLLILLVSTSISFGQVSVTGVPSYPAPLPASIAPPMFRQAPAVVAPDPIATLSAQVDRLEAVVARLAQSQSQPDPKLVARIAQLEAQAVAREKQIADLTSRFAKAVDRLDSTNPISQVPPPSTPVVAPPTK